MIPLVAAAVFLVPVLGAGGGSAIESVKIVCPYFRLLRLAGVGQFNSLLPTRFDPTMLVLALCGSTRRRPPLDWLVAEQ
jgi:hypothetical protein